MNGKRACRTRQALFKFDVESLIFDVEGANLKPSLQTSNIILQTLFQYFQQAVATDDGLAFGSIDFADCTVDRRRNGRFHLHGFRND